MADGILVVDDHVAIAQALTVTLREAGFAPVEALPAAEMSVHGVLAAAGRLEPSVALVDLNLGAAGSGLPLVHALCDAGTTVVVFTASNATSDIAASLRAGAVGFINKSEPFDAIVDFVRRAAGDGEVLTPAEREAIFAAADANDAEAADRLARFLSLTERERQVLALLADGLTPKQIAHANATAVGTVRRQLEDVRRKLKVQTQLAAVTLFREFDR